MKRIVTLLIAVAMVVGMLGCTEFVDNGTVSYQLTISSTSGGSVVEPVEGVHTYEEGTVVDLVAEPDAGYRFVSWTGDVGTIVKVDAASTTITMNGDYSIVAHFIEIVEYELTISSTTGGSVTTPGEGTFTYDAGTEVNLVASGDSGYRFAEWTGDVEAVANVNSASTTITIEGEYSVLAHFTEVVEYELKITSTAGGSVTTPGEGTFTYEEGAVVRLVATRSTGYRFANWTGDMDAVANPDSRITTITMDEDYSITANFEEEVPVVFVCPNLEAAIRDAIRRPTGDIYPSDLEGLSELWAESSSITDVTGLEYCVHLTQLSLLWNEISDISPLEGLTNLTNLRLGHNQISDISPLANLTNLTMLEVDQNQISDIWSLAGLTNLDRLWLHHNQISDVKPLGSLTSLTCLRLEGNQISDISPLESLTKLTSLGLSGHQISDVVALVDLTRLWSLVLKDSQISDISPLASLTNLTVLGLDDNEISDVSPLEGLSNLRMLYLTGNRISDISPLEGLINLTGLYLSGNQIGDISLLANLTTLQFLSLGRNELSDISPLEGLTNLTSLHLWNNDISDISPLAGLTRLSRLYLDRNALVNISSLAGLNNLTSLGLGGNQISDISPLESLTHLRWLSLWNNQISDVRPLVENPGLGEGDEVNLTANPLSEQSINEYIPALEARGVVVFYDEP